MPYSNPTEQREYQRDWKARRKAEWIAANGPCPCGSWDNLQVDHVDQSTKVDHRVWTWSEERRNAELAKCQVLCSDCHSAKTFAEQRTTTDEVEATILQMQTEGISQRAIATRLGIGRKVVRRVLDAPR